ncbi:hypothetical protein LguiB_001788 [Lonicera macranthoides]
MYQSARLMVESNVSYNYEFASHGCKIIKWNIPPPKGVVVVFNIHLREVSKDKLKNADGQIISCSVEEITYPLPNACIVISTHMLLISSCCDYYIQIALADHDIDQSTSDYLAPRIISHVIELTSLTNGWDNDTMSYEIEVGLIAIRVEVINEKHLFEGLKEEVFGVRDGVLSCMVCLEEVFGGSRCIRMTYSLMFHMFYIIQWLL